MMVSWEFPNSETVLENEFVKLYATDVERDAEMLFSAASVEENGMDIFEYSLGAGPFEEFDTFKAYLDRTMQRANSLTYTVFSKRLNKVVGNLSLLNINQAHGTIEVGSIWYTVKAQKTEINTNALFLIMSYVFEVLQYRRLEWKCNNENQESKRAALRLGFIPEGVFRQHFWDKGKNRDTAWFSIIDSEWLWIKDNFRNKLLW